ncbi:hypothetical protein B0T18DRAFT_451180, partial [Schizothecium vesticola]
PPSTVTAPARHLLTTYAGIPPGDLDAHIDAIRARAFAVAPYPCIGTYQFLDLSLRTSPIYPTLLAALRSGTGKTFLDLGCGLGQEVRQLVADGVPDEEGVLFATDLNGGLWEVGGELFRDQGRLKARFIEGDFFEEGVLGELEGGVDYVYAGAFFHLFGLEEQVRAVKRVVKLLRRGGGVVVGRQSGGLGPMWGRWRGRGGGRGLGMIWRAGGVCGRGWGGRRGPSGGWRGGWRRESIRWLGWRACMRD